MTITDVSNVKTYTGDNTTDTFSTVFIFFDHADLTVTVAGVAQVLDTDYTVTGGVGLVGSVVFTSAPATSAAIVIQRVIEYKQATDFADFDGNPSDVTEKQFDLDVMQMQQLRDAIERSISVPAGTANFDSEISITGNGSKFLQLKSDLTGYTFSTTLDTSSVVISTLGETLIADTTETAMRQTLLFPAQSASKRGSILVQNAADSGYEQITSQGTSGQVLKSNGADALPSFATENGRILLATQTASTSSTVSFTTGIDSTYSTYIIEMSNVQPSADGASLNAVMSVATTFQTGASDYSWVATNAANGTAEAQRDAATDTSIEIAGGTVGIGNASTEALSGTIVLSGPSSATLSTKIQHNSVYITNGGVTAMAEGAGAYIGAASAVDGIRFAMSSGTMVVGTFKLYGIV